MTVAEVRDELVAKLRTIRPVSGRCYPFAPESIQPPCAFLGVMTFNPRAAFDESDLTVAVWVATSQAASAQRGVEALDPFVDGADSVADALQTPASAWDSLAVTGIEYPVTITVGAGEYVAARFDCEVML